MPATSRIRVVASQRHWTIAAIPFLIIVTFSWWGIDWGKHWDEDHNKFYAVARSIENGLTLLPADGYHYPGVNYWLTFGSLSPELARTLWRYGGNTDALKRELLPVVGDLQFRLRVRRLYAAITALTAVWIYMAVIVWGGTWLEALWASLLFALSWEIVYHARFVAPDTLLMQFGALTWLLVAIAWRSRSFAALYAAAAAAGLACGSKYPGGLLLLPLFAVLWLRRKRNPPITAAKSAAIVTGIFAATYLVTTPGTVLDPLRFGASLKFVLHQYATGWYGYTVVPGLDHLVRMLRYLGVAALSPYRPLAIVASAFVLIGVWAELKRDRDSGLLLLVFPVFYLSYFCTQATMIARNYLAVVPFLAILAASGFQYLMSRSPSRALRAGLATWVAIFLVSNAIFQVRASASVADRRNSVRFLHEFEEYAARYSNRRIVLSPRLAAEMLKNGIAPGANLLSEASVTPAVPFDEYASYYSETVTTRERWWPSNKPHLFTALFGPREVNLDYHAGWWGEDRIIVLANKDARELAGVGRPRLKRLQWTGNVRFREDAGRLDPILVTGLNGAGDLLSAMRTSATTVRLIWIHMDVSRSDGVDFAAPPGSQHRIDVVIDFAANRAEIRSDGNPVLSYTGPVFPSLPEDVTVGVHRFRTDAIAEHAAASIHEIARQSEF